MSGTTPKKFVVPRCFITIKYGRRMPYDSFIVNPNCRRVTFTAYIRFKLRQAGIEIQDGEAVDLCNSKKGFLNLSNLGEDEYVSQLVEPAVVYYPLVPQLFESGNLRDFRLLYNDDKTSSLTGKFGSDDDFSVEERLKRVLWNAARRGEQLDGEWKKRRAAQWSEVASLAAGTKVTRRKSGTNKKVATPTAPIVQRVRAASKELIKQLSLNEDALSRAKSPTAKDSSVSK